MKPGSRRQARAPGSPAPAVPEGLQVVVRTKRIPANQALVFLAHAGADAKAAGTIARWLSKAHLEVLLDLTAVAPGDSFVQFMNRALERADYCLVLWSRHASFDSYIGDELAAAYVRTVRERRPFLLLGRLDSTEVPALFSPRVCIDFFPRIASGVEAVIGLCARDREARAATGKRLGPAVVTAGAAPVGWVEVYVCSSVFDRTVPCAVDPTRTGSEILSDVVALLGVPQSIDYEGRVGVRLHYSLETPEGSLGEGAVGRFPRPHSVLWLEVELEMFSAGVPVRPDECRPVFREGMGRRTGPSDQSEIRDQVAAELGATLVAAGLRDEPHLDAMSLRFLPAGVIRLDL